MKKFFESLREHAIKIISFKKKKIINKLLTNEQQESYENAKICYICNKILENKYWKDKKYSKVKDHCHYTEEYGGVVHSIFNLHYSLPKSIPIVFHNGSNYDYHFTIKELLQEFKKHITC